MAGWARNDTKRCKLRTRLTWELPRLEESRLLWCCLSDSCEAISGLCARTRPNAERRCLSARYSTRSEAWQRPARLKDIKEAPPQSGPETACFRPSSSRCLRHCRSRTTSIARTTQANKFQATASHQAPLPCMEHHSRPVKECVRFQARRSQRHPRPWRRAGFRPEQPNASNQNRNLQTKLVINTRRLACKSSKPACSGCRVSLSCENAPTSWQDSSECFHGPVHPCSTRSTTSVMFTQRVLPFAHSIHHTEC